MDAQGKDILPFKDARPGFPRIYAPPHQASWARKVEEFLRKKGSPWSNMVGFASSGSSGKPPKAVLFTQAALETSARAVNDFLNSTSDDIWCCALPTYHLGGYMIYERARLSGARVVHYAEDWNVESFARFLHSTRPSLLSLVPTQVVDLVRADCRAPDSLRVVIVGGAGLAPEFGRRARALGWPVVQSYGSSEAASQIATGRIHGELPVDLESAYVSDRLPVLSHWDVRIFHEEVRIPHGKACIPDGEISVSTEETPAHERAEGLLQLRGKALFSGYVLTQMPEPQTSDATDSDFVLVPQPAGAWWISSDVVRLEYAPRSDARGYPSGRVPLLTFIRRADRRVKILGEFVDLDALENEWMLAFSRKRQGMGMYMGQDPCTSDIEDAPDTEDVVCIMPLEDERRGHILVLCAPLPLEECERRRLLWNNSHSGLYALASALSLTLPRNPMGKIDRAGLRNMLNSSEI